MCLLMFNLLYWTKKKTNLIELKSMFQTHQKEVKLVKIFPTGDVCVCASVNTCVCKSLKYLIGLSQDDSISTI